MSVPPSLAQIEASIDGVARSIIDAWTTLQILDGLQGAHATGGVADESTAQCAYEIYNAAFTALYVQIGTVLDTSGDTLSLPTLIAQLEQAWIGDDPLLGMLQGIKAELSDNTGLRKLKLWRNKVIAHRTVNVQNAEFYADNKVALAEVRDSLHLVEDLLDRLSVNSIRVSYSLELVVPGLEENVRLLFGGRPGDP